MPHWYDSALERLSGDVERVRRRLAEADVSGLRADVRGKALAGELKAFSYVWMAASCERYVYDLLEGILAQINDKKVLIRRLKPSMIGLLLAPALDAVRDIRDYEKLWERRCGMFARSHSDEVAVFNTGLIPLDGRTLRPHHFDVIWATFGFDGSSFPSPLHRLALKDLADGRNTVAHGTEDPVRFGRGKDAQDVMRMTMRVEDIALHLIVAAEDYLLNRGYER